MIDSIFDFLVVLLNYKQYFPVVFFFVLLLLFLGYLKGFITFHKGGIDHAWRKEYKTLFIALALIISPFILAFESGVNDLLIFYTLVALLWYARETMDLKDISNKQIKELRKSEMNKFLPILRPLESNDLYPDGSCYVGFRNIGKGIAKDINLKLDSKEFISNSSVEPEESFSFNLRDEKEEIEEMVARKKKEISMSIDYKDIHDRTLSTGQMTLKLLPNGRYVPTRDMWRFKINEPRENDQV